jgi:large subunit ribosomal protein L28
MVPDPIRPEPSQASRASEEADVSRVCEVTGRRTRVGNRVARRGLAKKKGGVGRRVTGRSKRTFKPNIQTVRVLTPDGTVVRMKLSTRAIKTGVIAVQQGGKRVQFPLAKAIRGRNRAFTRAQRDA